MLQNRDKMESWADPEVSDKASPRKGYFGPNSSKDPEQTRKKESAGHVQDIQTIIDSTMLLCRIRNQKPLVMVETSSDCGRKSFDYPRSLCLEELDYSLLPAMPRANRDLFLMLLNQSKDRLATEMTSAPPQLRYSIYNMAAGIAIFAPCFLDSLLETRPASSP